MYHYSELVGWMAWGEYGRNAFARAEKTGDWLTRWRGTLAVLSAEVVAMYLHHTDSKLSLNIGVKNEYRERLFIFSISQFLNFDSSLMQMSVMRSREWRYALVVVADAASEHQLGVRDPRLGGSLVLHSGHGVGTGQHVKYTVFVGKSPYAIGGNDRTGTKCVE